MIKELTTPITIQKPWGTFTLTHVAYGFSFFAGRKVLQTHEVYGCMEGDNFVQYSGDVTIPDALSEFINHKVTDVDDLLKENQSGKRQGQFRTDDVIALHEVKKAEIKNRAKP